MRRHIPRSREEHLVSALGAVPRHARAVLVYDPDGVTRGRQQITDARGKEWACVHVWRNVLEASLRFRELASANSVLVCMTPPGDWSEGLDLGYLPEVAGALEDVIDLSLEGVIRHYLRDAALPGPALERYGALLTSDLERTITAFRETQSARRGQPLTEADVQLIALRAAVPQLPAALLRPEAVGDAASFLKLLFCPGLSAEAESVLRDYLRKVLPTGAMLRPWLDADRTDAAAMVYTGVALRAMGQPITTFTLRGAGVTVPGLDQLAPGLPMLVEAMRADPDLAAQVYREAEESIPGASLERLATEARQSSVPIYRLAADLPPGLSRTLLRQELAQVFQTQDAPAWLLQWAEVLRPSPAAQEDQDHLREAISLIASLHQRLGLQVEGNNQLDSLVDWYTGSGTATLEFDLWRVDYHMRQTRDRDLLMAWAEYRKSLRRRVRARLLELDRKLGGLIAGNVPGLLGHSRALTSVLRDTLLRHGLVPPRVPRVWFLVFDGMRWDIWERVVRPALETYFQIEQTRAYLSLLPSTTHISRTSLIASQLPDYWHSLTGQRTDREDLLSASAFGLKGKQPLASLQYLNRMEDRTGAADATRPYNVLIYNISDDWIHSERTDPFQVGQTVAGFLKNSIVPDLASLIGEGDIVVVSSDHGFIELDEADQQDVEVGASFTAQGRTTPSVSDVSYRYTRGVEVPGAIEVRFRSLGTFYVATGHTWYRRPGGEYTRYAHGGVSLAEMVVPGVRMTRKRLMETRLVWDGLPESISAMEDESVGVDLVLACQGGEPASFTLEATAGTVTPSSGTIKPGEKVTLRLELGPEVDSGFIRVSGKAATTSGLPARLESASLHLVRQERKDKVEFDMGALDLLEQSERNAREGR